MTVREKKAEFIRMANFFNGTCVKCEGKSGLINVERDHIIPKYQGGGDEPNNWQPLCAYCNSSKGPERTDWRKIFASKYGISIPSNWL
jgi:5-methylcytosine-specific restriction endonuclease McrA